MQHLHFAAAHSASRNTVIVHLSNGTRLTGIVLASDNYMILLGKTVEDPMPTVVYKRAITVVTPAHAPEADAAVLDAEASPDFVRLYTRAPASGADARQAGPRRQRPARSPGPAAIRNNGGVPGSARKSSQRSL